jgi:MFS family permease
MRATVQSVYASGVTLGAGLAFFFGGWIGQYFGWRTAFYFLGFPGLVVAVLVFLLREQPRGHTEVSTVKYTSKDWKVLFRSTPLRYHYAGYALFGLASNSLSIWGPTFITRVHGYNLATIGFYAGILSLVAGVPATVLGGYLSDRLRRVGPGGRMRLTSLAALFAIPIWLLLLFSTSPGLLLLSNFVLLGLSLLWVGPAMADVHDIAGPHLRGLGIGIFICAVNLTAYGVGAPLIGKINDILGAATNPGMMRYGYLISPLACGFAALLLWLGSRSMTDNSDANKT